MARDYTPTENGYWIEPGGTVHGLSEWQKHAKWMFLHRGGDPDKTLMDIEGYAGPHTKMAYDAEEEGWLKVTFAVSGAGVAFSFTPDKVGKGAIRSAAMILKDLVAVEDKALRGGICINDDVLPADRHAEALRWLNSHPRPLDMTYAGQRPSGARSRLERPDDIGVKAQPPVAEAPAETPSRPPATRPSEIPRQVIRPEPVRRRLPGGEQDTHKPRSQVRAEMDRHRMARSGMPSGSLPFPIWNAIMEGGDPDALELRYGETTGYGVSWDMYGDRLYFSDEGGESVRLVPDPRDPTRTVVEEVPTPYSVVFRDNGFWYFEVNEQRIGMGWPTRFKALDEGRWSVRKRYGLHDHDWREFRKMEAERSAAPAPDDTEGPTP